MMHRSLLKSGHTFSGQRNCYFFSLSFVNPEKIRDCLCKVKSRMFDLQGNDKLLCYHFETDL